MIATMYAIRFSQADALAGRERERERVTTTPSAKYDSSSSRHIDLEALTKQGNENFQFYSVDLSIAKLGVCILRLELPSRREVLVKK